MKSVKIGLIGLGTIGRGVYDAVVSNGELIEQRTGISLSIAGVCDTSKDALDSIDASSGDIIKTTSADDILESKDIDIVVELIGGIEPAKSIIFKALENKKNVVTANKALLSENCLSMLGTASDNGVFVNFEASVGGAIPVIKTLRESFVGNKFDTIYGILNGTTNFILSEMSSLGCSFDEALKVAQEKGFAESDPELDISGKDSAHKLAILSLLSFGADVSPDNIYTEGITHISSQDIDNAEDWGYSVKLLAIAKDIGGSLQLRVHPTLISSSHLLSDVKGADNAIFIKGDLIDDSLLFGKGAGRKPTSSSVVGDIVDIAKRIRSDNDKDANRIYNTVHVSSDKKLSNMEDLIVPFYLRFSVIDKPGVLASISSILSGNDISIANVVQEEQRAGESVPVVILTHKCREGNMRKAIEKINGQEYITDDTVVIRIEEDQH